MPLKVEQHNSLNPISPPLGSHVTFEAVDTDWSRAVIAALVLPVAATVTNNLALGCFVPLSDIALNLLYYQEVLVWVEVLHVRIEARRILGAHNHLVAV